MSGNVTWGRRCENGIADPQKVNIKLPDEPATAQLENYPKV